MAAQMVTNPSELPTELDVCAADTATNPISTEPQPSPSALLQLPIELRQLIYAFHFGQATLTLPLDRNLVIIKDWHRCKPYTIRGKRDFLCLNRQIYAEASDVLWQSTKVLVSFYTGLEVDRRFLRCQSQSMHSQSHLLMRMQHVLLRVHLPCQGSRLTSIDEPLKKLTGMLASRSALHTLRLYFVSPGGLEEPPHRLEKAYAAFRSINTRRVVACGSWKLNGWNEWSIIDQLPVWQNMGRGWQRWVLSAADESPGFNALLDHHKAANDNAKLNDEEIEELTEPGALYRPDDLFFYASIMRGMLRITRSTVITL